MCLKRGPPEERNRAEGRTRWCEKNRGTLELQGNYTTFYTCRSNAVGICFTIRVLIEFFRPSHSPQLGSLANGHTRTEVHRRTHHESPRHIPKQFVACASDLSHFLLSFACPIGGLACWEAEKSAEYRYTCLARWLYGAASFGQELAQ